MFADFFFFLANSGCRFESWEESILKKLLKECNSRNLTVYCITVTRAFVPFSSSGQQQFDISKRMFSFFSSTKSLTACEASTDGCHSAKKKKIMPCGWSSIVRCCCLPTVASDVPNSRTERRQRQPFSVNEKSLLVCFAVRPSLLTIGISVDGSWCEKQIPRKKEEGVGDRKSISRISVLLTRKVEWLDEVVLGIIKPNSPVKRLNFSGRLHIVRCDPTINQRSSTKTRRVSVQKSAPRTFFC